MAVKTERERMHRNSKHVQGL